MHIIGLIGGIACGKSAVARMLAERGAVVFDADQMAHSVIEEPEVREQLIARWGEAILDHRSRRILRRAIADRVFGDSAAAVNDRRFLEQLLHPRVLARIKSEISQLDQQTVPAAVIDAPLLLEAGWHNPCQIIVFVDCPRFERENRALGRGWTAAEFTRREAAQMPIEEKQRRATHVIKNSRSLGDLEAAVARFWASLA